MRLLEIAFLISVVLLLSLLAYSFETVSKEKYRVAQAAADKCEQERSVALSSAQAAAGKISALEVQYGECSETKNAIDRLYRQANAENAQLKVESVTLAEARKKVDAMVKYELLEQYYNDAFGPGKVPNTAKLSKISAQALETGDSQAVYLWNNVRGCASISECDSAKGKFIAHIGAKTDELSRDIVAIVRAQ